jgi:extracellular elastinolytic metalloproteinase
MRGKTHWAVSATGLALALTVSAHATFAQAVSDGFDHGRTNAVAAPRGQALAAVPGAVSADVVRSYLRARGFSAATVDSLRQVGANTSRSGLVHLKFEQQVGGLRVHGRYLKAAINARGELVHLIENLAAVPTASLAGPAIAEPNALRAAMARVHPDAQINVGAGARNGNATTFPRGAFFFADPSVTRVAVPMSDGSMTVGMLVETWGRKKNQLHHTLVGRDGRILDVQSRTANDSYNVFQVDPGKTPQTVVQGPAPGGVLSPEGWLSAGDQSTIRISGNNTSAYLDATANNQPDHGGSAVPSGNFLAVADFSVSPSTPTNQAVAVQNLFYLTNVVHDILYRLGFNEQAGNFQENNFGRGGEDGDPVRAEAQDGEGTDNANFATPADGKSPRMQMFLWSGIGATHEVNVNPAGPSYVAVPAEWSAFTTTGLSGNVVLVNDGVGTPTDACEPITANLRRMIALVDRGICSFAVKAQNAQRAGAAGLIVANNVPADPVVMGASGENLRIPAVMISQADGAALRALASPNVTVRMLSPQPLQIDAALDSDVVYHEYGHGLTWRMIGGMSGPFGGAVGEGMSDGVAMLINNDDRIGEYSASNPNGIRRFRYTGYPLTYKEVKGEEVHNDGEIYAAIVWRMIELFKAAYGDPSGRDRLFSYVVDGMNFTPSTPAYEQMRDGILAAVRNGPTPSDCNLVWQAFGQFGVGDGAKGVLNGTAVQITESFVVPSCN